MTASSKQVLPNGLEIGRGTTPASRTARPADD